MGDTQVPAKFSQFEITKLSAIIYDDNSWMAKVIDDRFLNEVLYSGFYNFGKRFGFHPLCEVVYGHK